MQIQELRISSLQLVLNLNFVSLNIKTRLIEQQDSKRDLRKICVGLRIYLQFFEQSILVQNSVFYTLPPYLVLLYAIMATVVKCI